MGISIVAINPAVTLEVPVITATASENSFRVAASTRPSRSSFDLDIDGPVVAWTGALLGTSVWIISSEGQVHRLKGSTEGHISRETLSGGDSVAVLSGGITFGMERLEDTLSMSLCDQPSPASSCSWILDAADDQDLPGIHFVGLWVPERLGS